MRGEPWVGLREGGPLGKFICTLPSGNFFWFASEDSDSRPLPTCLSYSFRGPHPHICGIALSHEALPESCGLTPAPGFRGPFGQRHLEEAQKSASSNNCLDPGLESCLEGIKTWKGARHDLPAGLGWAGR